MADGLCLSSIDRHKVKAMFMPLKTSCLQFSILFLFLYCIVPVSGSKECRNCEQGNCLNGSCVCLPGWRNRDDSGKYCNECYGRISLHEKEGIIYDGSSNYSKDHACSWLLDTGQIGMRVTFQINQLATECIWDHLYVHDGDSAFSPLVAAYSGVRVGLQTKPSLKFKLSSRYAYIHFYSDAAYTLPGFNVSYIVDNCSIACSDNSVCNNGTCDCKPGWSGDNCESLVDGCASNCSDHGTCENGVCQCFEGFRGDDCYFSDQYLFMEQMNMAPSSMAGRASFAFTKDDSGFLWIIGGYRMGDTSVDGNLYKYDTKSEVWDIPAEDNPGPWPRYGHTAVFYKGALYLYGGIRGIDVMEDFWMYTISTKTWTKLSSGPRNLSGHSAEVVDTRMLIFFGYSSDYGYSNKVLEYDFVNQTWKVLETHGSVVQGGYGHVSVYDQLREKIYVYGGYHSPGHTPYNLTDMLYEFEPNGAVWTILHSSGKNHYLHSAAMMNGLMLVFGGNTNNDSRMGRQACYTSDFLVYDRSCNRWHTQNVHLSSHIIGLDRFGQCMISDGNDIYLFGGFHAWSKKDLWKITAGLCSSFNESKSCEESVPGIKCVWNNETGCVNNTQLDTCLENHDVNFNCSGFNRCEGCLSKNECIWCSGNCFSVDYDEKKKDCHSKVSACPASVSQNCGMYLSCRACQENSQCVWSQGKCKAYTIDKKTNKTGDRYDCEEKQCSRMGSCMACTKAENCLWCSNLNQCILTKSYVAFYFYGQCQDWTTKTEQCQASNCSALKTCDSCSSHPRCGWCDDNSGTGTGFCHEGGMEGPITTSPNITSDPVTDFGVCPKTQWFFTTCPKCQCNGHSQCANETSTCTDCQSHTSGSQCQYCEDGYFGDPLNGGNCSVCSCNDQADSCNPVTGDCFCKIRGVIGKKCDRCDDDYRHEKHAGSGTCFYHLNTDFSYTFNLSKREDSNYTQINFINTPTSSDRDVDFTLNCSTGALINITYTSKSHPIEKVYVSDRGCDYFRTKFEHKNHAFGGKENTTFYVYVYDFKTPFKLQISFVQRDKLNLVRFFIIFFSCFLSLLLIAAALWKIKHKYDSYRRRRQLIVEMQQMASRPFSSISVEIDRKSSPAAVDKRDHLDSVLRRRKKAGTKPSEVAIEPLADSKAAILTLIIQLPTGGSDFAPAGQSGLAMGSAFVSMGSHRKQSLDHAKGDKPKLRKHLSNVHPDTCA